MRKSNSIKCILLLLFILTLTLFSFKGQIRSMTAASVVPLESNPRGIAINPISDIAVVSNEKADLVSIVDLNSQAVLSTIPVGKAPRGVAIDRALNIAVVGNSHDNNLSVIDLNTYQVISIIPVGKEPEGIAVNPSNHTALVANHKDDTVLVIDLMTYKVIGTIPVGKEPKDIAIDPDLNLALVVNEKVTLPSIPSRQGRGDFGVPSPLEGEGGGEGGLAGEKDYIVSIIDLNTYQVTGEVQAGQKPQAIDINPETHLAGVVNEKDNSITIIDLLNWQTNTIPVGKHHIDIAINPLDNRALVICDEDRSLLLIDLDTNTILKTYSLNKLPKGIAVNNFTNIAAVVDDKTDSLTLIQLPNPVPQITSINPDTLLRGSKATNINIEGSGFIKSSSISLLPATPYTLNADFIDNHNLKVEIPETLLAKAGKFQIAVTNPSPEGGTSNPVNLQINNPIPSISMLDPIQTMAYTPGLTLSVYGTGFFDDTTVYINGIPRPFTLLSQTKLQVELTASDLEAGAYIQVTASNPPPGGGLSNKAIFTVLNPIPELTSINPTSIIAGSPDLTLKLTGNNFVKTSLISFNNQTYQSRYISKTQIEATIPSDAIKTPGSYSVKAINPAPGGGESSPLPFTVKPPLEIKIISPADGETINKAKIMIKGTFKSDTNDIGINVNGIIAELSGSNWIANNVPLVVGINTITATATDSYGNTDTKNITIYTNDITQQIEISANITSGIAPLQVFFSASTSFTPVSYQMDFEGDGVIDYSGASFENLSFTYNSEGIVYPTVTVTDNQRNTYSDTIAITVINKTEIDTLLKGKWEGMKGELKQKNIDKSLDYFIEQSKERYRTVFEALKDQLPMIMDTFVEFNIIGVFDNFAEYELVANENGVLYSYPGRFIKNGNGIWKFNDF